MNNRALSFKFYRDGLLLAGPMFLPRTVRFIRSQYPEGVLKLTRNGTLPITRVKATGFEGGTMAVHFE